jgi:hypothetical protein
MSATSEFLIFSKQRVVGNYKLRTYSDVSDSFIIKNISQTHIVTVLFGDTFDGVFISPTEVVLRPHEEQTIQVTYNIDYLDNLPVGNLLSKITYTATARRIPVDNTPSPIATPTATPPNTRANPVIKVAVVPTSDTFSVLNEVKNYSATLTVDDIIIPNAQFTWTLQPDNTGFTIGANGSVRATVNSQYTSTVIATVASPSDYMGYTGHATAQANIGNRSNAVGTLRFKILGDITQGVDITVNGPNAYQTTVTSDASLTVASGQYNIIPRSVTINGVTYNPSNGSSVSTVTDQTTEVVVTYNRQETKSYYIKFASVPLNKASVGDIINVSAYVYESGNPSVPVNVGPITFGANNTIEGTVEGVLLGSSTAYSADFTLANPGTTILSATNTVAGTITVNISVGEPASTYTIVMNGPDTLVQGSTGTVTAVVYKNGIAINTPVTFTVAGAGQGA